MLGKKIQDAMNEQIKNEFYSAYQYLSMAAYCESMNLSGFAHWMRAQSREETEHAMKFFDFVLDRGGRVVLQAMEQPVVGFGLPLEVLERALEHVREVTAMIKGVYVLGVRENDYASLNFLLWFGEELVGGDMIEGNVV